MGALSLARFTASAGSEFFAGEGARATSPVTPDRASSCPRRFPPAKGRSRDARSPFAPERGFASRHSLLPELRRPIRREPAESFGISATFDNRSVDSDHRHLDQIGCGALQGRIDRGSLGKAPEICILAVDIWDWPHSPEQRLNFLFAAGFLESLVDELTHTAVLFKIGIDESLGFGGLDAKVLR